jgi:hypothetical protein
MPKEQKEKPVEEKAPERVPIGVLPGWYWHKGVPVEVMDINGTMMARGYDFTSKEEWRTSVSMIAEDLRPVSLA